MNAEAQAVHWCSRRSFALGSIAYSIHFQRRCNNIFYSMAFAVAETWPFTTGNFKSSLLRWSNYKTSNFNLKPQPLKFFDRTTTPQIFHCRSVEVAVILLILNEALPGLSRLPFIIFCESPTDQTVNNLYCPALIGQIATDFFHGLLHTPAGCLTPSSRLGSISVRFPRTNLVSWKEAGM